MRDQFQQLTACGMAKPSVTSVRIGNTDRSYGSQIWRLRRVIETRRFTAASATHTACPHSPRTGRVEADSWFRVCNLSYFDFHVEISCCAVHQLPPCHSSGAPSTNTFNSLLAKGVQTSFVVNGSVTITATRSLGVVTCEKSTLMSSSESFAVENGCWRTM